MKLAAVALIWLVIFFIRFQAGFQASQNLDILTGQKIEVVGRIASEPTLQATKQSFRLGRIEVVTKAYPSYEYGQKLAISGTLQRKMINSWYSQFRLVYPSIKAVTADNNKTIGYRFKQQIFKFRQRIESIYNQTLPEPEASFLSGIVLGTKRNLPQDFFEALRKTSTLHLVVASGYNVTVVMATTIAYLAGWLKRRWAVVVGIGAVAIYTLMAGAEPAIVRAAIMGSLAYLGQLLGRQADGLRLLLAAALVMLLFEPLLIWDIGWQLSFTATAGLMLLSPLLGRLFNRIWLIGKNISETSAAQIAVTPLLWWHFGYVSPFAILVNSLILWLVPINMGLGAILALVGFIWLPLARILAWLNYSGLTLMVRVVEWFSYVG